MEDFDEATLSSLDAGREAFGGGPDGSLRTWKAGCGIRHLQAVVVRMAGGRAAVGEGAKAEGSRERALERENRKLKEALASKVLEADFLQGVLRRIEARRQPISGSGETASTRKSE